MKDKKIVLKTMTSEENFITLLVKDNKFYLDAEYDTGFGAVCIELEPVLEEIQDIIKQLKENETDGYCKAKDRRQGPLPTETLRRFKVGKWFN